jgi:hypothetical protein
MNLQRDCCSRNTYSSKKNKNSDCGSVSLKLRETENFGSYTFFPRFIRLSLCAGYIIEYIYENLKFFLCGVYVVRKVVGGYELRERLLFSENTPQKKKKKSDRLWTCF